MQQYVDLLTKVLNEGEPRRDRTGTGTHAIFGGMIEFDLRKRFPLVTVKKTLWEKMFHEMLWFISGDTNIKYLKDNDVNIWDGWADQHGSIGPGYGYQWRKWPGLPNLVATSNPSVKHGVTIWQPGIDQIKQAVDALRNNPKSRRILVSAWNVADLDKMGLPPCHWAHQLYVSNHGYLDMMVHMRSWDLGLGAPFNIGQYALLAHMYAHVTGLSVRHLKFTYGDAHIYDNHIDDLQKRLDTVQPIECPTQLVIKRQVSDIDDFEFSDFDVIGYASHPFLKLEVSL